MAPRHIRQRSVPMADGAGAGAGAGPVWGNYYVIQQLLELFQTTSSIEERPQSGRFWMTGHHDDRFIRLTALPNRAVTAERP